MKRHLPPFIGILFLCGMAVLTCVPLLWALSGSFQTNSSLAATPYSWFPPEPSPQNYADAVSVGNSGRAILNSLVVALIISSVGVVVAQMAGYVLAKHRFLGRDLLFWTIVSTMLIPFPAIMVPVFIIARSFGLVDSLAGLILPGLIASSTVFFMRQYMQGLPDELLESARVDGAGEWTTYWRIVFPLAWPVLISMALLTFVGSWNNFLWPLVVIQSPENMTIPLAMNSFKGQYFNNNVVMLAMSVLATLPVVVLFLLGRRRILDSVMVSGGLK
ncbi:carbohydrate ABC transporter permease [Herbiconiux sp. A18JL235]|uniref:Carbohydrate ABC transporter permease n=1 Tax=Herbiconiux sp. A18JL235 TaxID=3152363 RepID=A0AB39BGN1_9MICO